MDAMEYALLLEASGMEEREVARAYFYAEKFGIPEGNFLGDDCVVFKIPTCNSWNCVNPDHQVLGLD